MPAILGKISVISRSAGLYRTEKLQNAELNACHHSFILLISKNPGLSQEQIAKRLCLNKSTVARSLNHLEEKGYVTRKPSESDKRVLLVDPTEKMLEIYPEVRRITSEWNEQLAEGVSPEELELFLDVLKRMANRAKELVGNADMPNGDGRGQ